MFHYSILNRLKSQPYFILIYSIEQNPSSTFFEQFQWNKNPSSTLCLIVPYFRILNRLSSQLYLIFAFWTIEYTSRTLALPYISVFINIRPQPDFSRTLFCHFNRLKPQTYLILAFWTIEDPNSTLAVPYFSLLNNIRLQPYLILAF